MDKFLDVDQYNATGQLIVSDNLQSATPGTSTNPLVRSGSGILEFIDAIGAVTSIITLLVNLMFTPFGLLMGAGLPSALGVMIGTPLIVLTVLGLMYFVRSGS